MCVCVLIDSQIEVAFAVKYSSLYQETVGGVMFTKLN